jgi:hypothetical protein
MRAAPVTSAPAISISVTSALRPRVDVTTQRSIRSGPQCGLKAPGSAGVWEP